MLCVKYLNAEISLFLCKLNSMQVICCQKVKVSPNI